MDFNELERKVNEAVAERDGQISLLSERLEAAKIDLEAAKEKEAAAKSTLDGAALVAAQTEKDAAQKTAELINERLIYLKGQPVDGEAELKQTIQNYMGGRHAEAMEQIGALVKQMQEISATLDEELSAVYRLGAKVGMRDYGILNRGVHEVVEATKEKYRAAVTWH